MAGSASYFQRANVLWMAGVTLLMGLFVCTVFWPTHVPYEQLGPLGSLAHYLVKNHYTTLYHGFWITWSLHLAEALYGLRLCSTKGITDSGARLQWFIQTFLFGIGSLSLLLAYKPGKKRR